MQHFADKLNAAIEKKKSMICVGLDPQLDHIPAELLKKFKPADALFEFNKGIIDAVSDLVPIVKLQSAFYELLGVEGVRVFAETLKYATSKGLLTIADAKRNDVGHTAEAYAQAFLGSDVYNADSLTVTPYLGWDGIKPFVEVARKNGKGLFVLVKTSNPSSGDLQDLEVDDHGGKHGKIFEIMGHFVESWGADEVGESGYSFVGAVVGATFPPQAKRLREIMPTSIFLVPGYGAQGGTAEGVRVCLNEDGRGAIVNSSRGIICAWEKTKGDYKESAREAVMEMQKDLGKI